MIDKRDQELLNQLRKVSERTAEFVEEAEQGEMGTEEFAGTLVVLMRRYQDTADLLRARASALHAAHPWDAVGEFEAGCCRRSATASREW